MQKNKRETEPTNIFKEFIRGKGMMKRVRKRGIVVVSVLGFLLVVGMVALASATNHTGSTQNTSVNKSANVTGAGAGSSGVKSPVSTPTTGVSSGSRSTEGEQTKIDAAYRCLEGAAANKSAFSVEESALGMLALGAQKRLADKLTESKGEREACWPKQACSIKNTAQVLLAQQRVGGQTADIERWLLSQRTTPSELSWYLEIDSTQGAASCTVKYDGREYVVNILEDMKLSDDAGSCLQRSQSGYWLRVANVCMGKTFDVSCDKDFVTALIYQKSGGETVYVSSQTHAASGFGTASEQVNVSCFTAGTSCDYEGSLWAAFALQKAGKDISHIKPYLIALAEDNTRFFPAAFLYLLTSDNDYYSQIVQQQKQNRFWEFVGNGYGRFYDTALGALALGSGSTGNSDLAKTQNYLLGVQTKEGCWNNNNFRDTAFVLWSSWSRKGATPVGPGPGNLIACVEAGFSCERISECVAAGGVKKDNYECPSGGSICCSVKVQRETCASQNGRVCAASQRCDGGVFPASDGECCLGACVEQQTPRPNACEAALGACKAACGKGEKEVSESCSTNANDVCCVKAAGGGGGLWVWILILGILIVLLVIAIVKRNAIRLWMFKRRGKVSSAPVMRPGFPPSGAGTFMRPQLRPMMGAPRFSRAAAPATPAAPRREKDVEMEETMKKLREMAK